MDQKDSCCRRKLIAESEALLQELWAESSFCLIERSDKVVRISRQFFDVIDSIEFTSDKICFFGAINDETDHRAPNSLPFLSTCLILLASNVEDQIDARFEAIERFVKRHFKNSLHFLNCLMSNDDRLFYCLLSLMKLSKKISNFPLSLDPFLLSLMLLHEIDFSETVFIDWLCSETVFVAFSTQFFKLLIIKASDIRRYLNDINALSAYDQPIKNTTYDETDNVLASFKIKELHGDELVERVYDIKERVKAEVINLSSSRSNFTLDNLKAFIARIHGKLEALNKRELLPFNAAPLIRVIKQADNCYFQ